MGIVECAKGHVYDSEKFAACPYCNSGVNMREFGSVAQVGKTSAPGMASGAAPNAMPPAYASPSAPSRTAAPGMSADRIMPAASAPSVSAPNKTVAPEAFRRSSEQKNKTVGMFSRQHSFDPVVGWLVCIEGAERGRSFSLWARINTIGRSDSMDVCIRGDQTVSREDHARLAYDPKHNAFQLIPGDSTNNIYLNDEPVYVPAKLSAYDCIEFGECKMLFVPFCCDRFQWDSNSTK